MSTMFTFQPFSIYQLGSNDSKLCSKQRNLYKPEDTVAKTVHLMPMINEEEKNYHAKCKTKMLSYWYTKWTSGGKIKIRVMYYVLFKLKTKLKYR